MIKDYIIELREEEADELMKEHWVSELVRCKDCKYSHNYAALQTRPFKCMKNIEYHEGSFFCSDGKRKDEE